MGHNHPQMHEELNKLIQRGVEHGFVQFYDRMETFIRQLTLKSSSDDQQLQSGAITMDNIWIYVSMYAAANCFGGFVFLCEIVTFHRKKIWRTVTRAFTECRRIIAVYWQKLLTKARAMVAAFLNALKRSGNHARTTINSIRDTLNGLWTNLYALIHNTIIRR